MPIVTFGQIPVPPRGYPSPAIISGQLVLAADPTPDPAKTLAQWNHEFTARRQFAPRDQLTLEGMFNESGDDRSALKRLAAAPKHDDVIAGRMQAA